MPPKISSAFAALLFVACGGATAAPKVAVDIAPVHSLVAAVMGQTATPELLLRPGASPHGYAMAPSEARALAGADLVFWVGPALTPWLDRAIDTLAPTARTIAVMQVKDIQTLPFREGALFDDHDHAHDHAEAHEDHNGHKEPAGHTVSHDDHDHHGEDHHDEHHEDHEHHEDGDHGHEDHADENHGAEPRDPHIWLDPRNAQVITRKVMGELVEADPANAPTYLANGARLIERLAALEKETAETLSSASDRAFVVFHDAYHYFEARFGVEASGAIALSDAAAPGPARLSEIQGRLRALTAPCVFAEPQFSEAKARLVMEGTDARLAILDPMGADITPGPEHYFTLIRKLAHAMTSCLTK